MPRKKKNKPIKRASSVDFSSPYSGAIGKSKNRGVADRIYQSRVTPEERQLGSVLTQDSEGNYIRRTRLSSPASYKNGGGIRKKARQIARKAVERQKAVAKNLKKNKDPRAKAAGREVMKRVRKDRKRIKKNYIQTRKDIKEQLKKK